MANGWTPERRARQAQLIKTWQPWSRSTGPVTEAGKTKAARNSWRGGQRQQLRLLSKLVKEELRLAEDLLASVRD